ncbi:hypothetical protein HPB48_008793 [Haemaphysalis longicornis]|uniref:Uncharacterized protein n=1 Tax=Haemaphysalis longicornis TaxID=44386 RepID=A0A9J6H174_HAELO|nr:hypothetical protein HPB48_008793 [Haemaphysalis longicornis]
MSVCRKANFLGKRFLSWVKCIRSVEKIVLLCEAPRQLRSLVHPFYVLEITCVLWLLYMIISHTGVKTCDHGSLDRPLWTKLLPVAIGITGGLVITCVLSKIYVQLLRRRRAFNRVSLRPGRARAGQACRAPYSRRPPVRVLDRTSSKWPLLNNARESPAEDSSVKT